MFLIERSVVAPRSRPRTMDGQAADQPAAALAGPGDFARMPPALMAPALMAPVPATFLEPAAGGAFELFPRRQFHGPGDLVQGSLPNPLMASLLPCPERPFRATAPLPPLPALPLPAAPRLRRRA